MSKNTHIPVKFNQSAIDEWNRLEEIRKDVSSGKIDKSELFKPVDLSATLPLNHDVVHNIIMSRPMPENIFDESKIHSPEHLSAIASTASNTVGSGTSIAELARSLKNDPQLIYEYVANNIDFVPIYGVQKGAWGALMDGQGTSFDISMLLVELLRAAGITAKFLVGQITLTAAQATNFLGCPITPHGAAAGICWSGQIPYSWTVNSSNQLDTLTMTHCWVKWLNPGNSQWYVFDAALKNYTYKPAVNLATATGYNQSTFMTNAIAGATYDLTPGQFNYIENLNRANIRNNLTSYSTNLVNWLKANAPGACMDDVVGGRSINAVAVPSLLADLPHHKSGDVPLEYTDIPIQYKITCRLQLGSFRPVNPWWFDQTFTSEQLHGKTMTFWVTNGGKSAELRLDGVLLASYNDSTYTVAVGHQMGYWYIQHNAYSINSYNQWSELWSWFDNSQPDGTGYMCFNTAFGTMGRGLSRYHAKKMEANIAAGFAETSPEVLGEMLSSAYYSSQAYMSRGGDLMGRLADGSFQIHHSAGWNTYWKSTFGTYSQVMGYPSGSLAWQCTSLIEDSAKRLNTAQATTALFLSTEYMGLVDAFDVNGASANRYVDVVASLGGRIQGTLTSTARIVETYPVGQAYAFEDSVGYAQQQWFSNASISNDGGFSKGGILSKGRTICPPKDEDCEEQGGGGGGGFPNQPCETPYETEDVSTGSAGFPYGLTFERSYCGCEKVKDGPLGRGWTHNFAKGVQTVTNLARALGSMSPIDACAAIISAFIVRDLLDSATPHHLKPFERMVTIDCIASWWADQVYKNSVIVELSGGTETFIKLPDGTYNAPLNNSATLTRDGLGIYRYKSAQGVTLTFDSQDRLSTWAYPVGPTVALSYSGDKLQSVSNGLGRQLNFVYSGNKLSQVNDGAGRSVSYGVGAITNELNSFTNADGKTYSYVYDQPGRLQKVFGPNSATVPLLIRTFDTVGRVKSEKNANNQESTYYCAGSRSEEVNPAGIGMVKLFDHRGNVKKIVNTLGDFILMDYDCQNRMTKRVMPEGNSFEYTYDVRHNLLTATAKPKAGSPLAPITTTFTYDSTWNKVKTVTDPLGRVTTFNYSATNGSLLSVVYPLVDAVMPTVSFTYNTRGQLLTRTDPTGIVTKWNYDVTTENLLSLVHDFGTGRLNLTTSFGYDAAGNINSVTDPNGNTSTALFDAERRLKEITAPAPFSYLTKLTWDGQSNLTKIESQTGDALNPWQTEQFAYTPTEKLQTVTDPSNNVTTLVYDGLERLWKITDAALRTTEYSYDSLNRLSTIKDSSTTIEETRTYTVNGNLSTVKDARNFITTYQYDGFDRLSKVIYPDATYEQYTYDATGNVLTFRTRGSKIITNTYDSHDRRKTQIPDVLATRTFYYDAAGRLTKVNTPVVANDPTTGDFQFFYDTAGRFFKETTPDAKSSIYQMDANGNVTRLTYPDGYYVTYIFDKLDRLTDIKLNGSASAAAHFDYDSLSRRKKLTLENGTVVDYGYELDNDMNNLVHTFVGSSATFTHAFNAVGQLTSQQVSDSQFVWHPGAGGTTAYGAANNLNQYPTVGTKTYAYSTAGNVTSDGTWTFGYDALDRMTSATKSGTTLGYTYDPLDRQTMKTLTTSGTTKNRFLYDGLQMIAEYNGTSGALIARNVFGPGFDEPLIRVDNAGVKTYLHSDRLGSIIARTNATGSVLDKYKYSSFGETPSLANSTFGYTGQRYDADLGMYYYKARIYNPAIGRFLQPDPIGYDGGFNLYEYVGNDPLNATDPLGLAPGGLIPQVPKMDYSNTKTSTKLKGYISENVDSSKPGKPGKDVTQPKGDDQKKKDDKDKKDEISEGESCKPKDKNKDVNSPEPGGPTSTPIGGGNATPIIANNPVDPELWKRPGAGEVGPYKKMKLPVGDNLDAHHIPQRAQLIKQTTVNPQTSPAVKIPPEIHRKLPVAKGDVPIEKTFVKQLRQAIKAGLDPKQAGKIVHETAKNKELWNIVRKLIFKR